MNNNFEVLDLTHKIIRTYQNSDGVLCCEYVRDWDDKNKGDGNEQG
jgi:hypothetical protein